MKEFYTLRGENLLRDAPYDHLHHHGLMFGITVNGIDFWAETPGCGVQKPIHARRPEFGIAAIATPRTLLDWHQQLAERFVRSIKESCLDQMVLIGEASLHRATLQFVLHYHHERNHQGLGNKIIRPEFAEFPAEGAINCRERLGGPLRWYYREAAGESRAREFPDSTGPVHLISEPYGRSQTGQLQRIT